MTEFFTTPRGHRLAYCRSPGTGPGIFFIHGLKSDMEGTKALALEAWAQAQGRAFLRFDCSGHGRSSGCFAEGTIGDWLADALAVLEALSEGPQVVVGSSMGGWLALLLARAVPGRFAGLVTIAAAPDFTEEGFWAGFSAAERHRLATQGFLDLPSDYGAPLRITRRLIEEGRNHLLLQSPLVLPMPVRLLQGSADSAVPQAWAERLFAHAQGGDIRLTVVKGADHRFSEPSELRLIEATVAEISSI